MSYLDTRDLAERLDELEARETPRGLTAEELEAEDRLDEDEREELAILRELENDLGSEFRDGMTMIPESEFEDYAREFAEDIGVIPSGIGWPFTCIDWKQAASDLAMDYTSVTYDGTDYYVR